MPVPLGRANYGQEQNLFRDSVHRFFVRALYPNMARWDEQGVVDRDFWKACGEAGLLCPGVPEDYGGLGLDYSYNAIVGEELAYAGSSAGLLVHSDIVTDYIVRCGSEEQKRAWLPRMVTGEVITAIAMTEPGAGSDLKNIRTTARRDSDTYILNGAKTYITNGQLADLVIVIAKTDPTAGSKGMSLLLVETDRPGFTRGRNLDKIGMPSSDTSELFFDDVRVPKGNLLGEEGNGFAYMMSQLPQERLAIAITAQAGAQRAFDEALAFTKNRKAFGRAVFDFQNTRFVLAELAAELQVGWAHLDWAIGRHIAGQLGATEASAAKLWHSELLWRACDQALQLHGGAGYMNEYPIARLWRDARAQRIYGGTSEIMKEIISRAL
jgi:alkylation response protein AidB-like acyl-CoA dehydrogenase